MHANAPLNAPAQTNSSARNPSGFVRRDRAERRRTARPGPNSAGPVASYSVDAAALAAVARLKGLDNKAIAFACALSQVAVASYFAGKHVSLRAGAKQAIADFLGVDLSTGRLKGNRVHFFHMANLGRFASRAQAKKTVSAIAPMLRGAKAAKLGFPTLNMMARAATPAVT